MLDYSPMWETMRRKEISQYCLLKAGIDNKTLDSIKSGRVAFFSLFRYDRGSNRREGGNYGNRSLSHLPATWYAVSHLQPLLLMAAITAPGKQTKK